MIGRKTMSEILKVKVQDENGNVFYIHTSADVVFCADGTSVQDRLGQKLDKSVIIQNATTAATDKVPSAAVAKDLQDQINQQNTKIDSKANSPSRGDYGCFFIALNSKVYLFIPLATVHSKTFTLKEIAVAGGEHMGTQNTFNLAWKLMNGLLFESTDSNVVFLFKDTYKGHAILGTAGLDIV